MVQRSQMLRELGLSGKERDREVNETKIFRKLTVALHFRLF